MDNLLKNAQLCAASLLCSATLPACGPADPSLAESRTIQIDPLDSLRRIPLEVRNNCEPALFCAQVLLSQINKVMDSPDPTAAEVSFLWAAADATKAGYEFYQSTIISSDYGSEYIVKVPRWEDRLKKLEGSSEALERAIESIMSSLSGGSDEDIEIALEDALEEIREVAHNISSCGGCGLTNEFIAARLAKRYQERSDKSEGDHSLRGH